MQFSKLFSFIAVVLLVSVVFTGLVAAGQAQVSSNSSSVAAPANASIRGAHNVTDATYHETDPYLAQTLNAKLLTLSLQAQGKSAAEIESIVKLPLPGGRVGLPAIGTVQIPVFLVDFSDAPHAASQTQADVQSKMFGSGDAAKYPYESLKNFYSRSSYSQLNIQGKVFPWYRAAHPRTYYESFGPSTGYDVLVKEVFKYWDSKGVNFAPYDNDNNGVLDSFFIKWAGAEGNWGTFWWGWTTGFADSSFAVDGKTLNLYVWSEYSYVRQLGTYAYDPHTDIHETGHLLGLPDYYDYDCSQGPINGLGGLDMMDAIFGDHNAFSKLLLGWITNPTVIATGGSQITKSLNPSGTSTDCVIIMPMTSFSQSAPYSEFFIAQYRKRGVGNDPMDYPADGLIVWHVDARLDSSGTTFAYDNSFASHKLLRLMEADGLEEIEHSACSAGSIYADAGDYYNPPKVLGPSTTPNSNNYAGATTGVIITPLSAPGTTMQVQFKLDAGTKQTTTTTFTASTTTPAVGTSVTFTVNLNAGTTGLDKSVKIWHTTDGVRWEDGTHNTVNGVYSFTQSFGSTGQRIYHAEFAGDSSYLSSLGTVTVNVGTTPTLTLSSTNYNPSAGQQYTLSGLLTDSAGNPLANKPIDIYYHFPSAGWQFSNTVYTGADGKYSSTASSSKTIILQTGYKVGSVYAASSNVVTITVQSTKPTLTLSSTSYSPSSGQQYTLSGYLRDSAGNGLANKPIDIYYHFAGEAWQHSNTVYTGADGKYSTTTSSSKTIILQTGYKVGGVYVASSNVVTITVH